MDAGPAPDESAFGPASLCDHADVKGNSTNWLKGLLVGIVLGFLLLVVLKITYVVARGAWDYRRELAPVIPFVVFGLALGNPSFANSPTLIVVAAALAVAAGIVLARQFWAPASLAAGRKERFLSYIRRAWPVVAARSVGGRGRDWRTVLVSPSRRGVDLDAQVPIGVSVQDLSSRTDAIAAAYSAALCSVTRDPKRADLARVSLDWKSKLPIRLPRLQTWP